jgi:uncharacterized protein (UPF0264 family)
VTPGGFEKIRAAVDGAGVVTAALGDVEDLEQTRALARAFVARGAELVKVGFAGISAPSRVEWLLRNLVGASADIDEGCGIVAVAYADSVLVESIDPVALIEAAAEAGATGVLVDTVHKGGPGLTRLWTADTLTSWVSEAHRHELMAAVAGKLGADDLAIVEGAGADIVGVRGAVCLGGRSGRVSEGRVRGLRESLLGLTA